MGPLSRPRSGEILEADIMWWHNVLGMLQEWITVQTGVVRPEARGVRLPDELMGDAMRFVACHEVGHSLGLRHNMIAPGLFRQIPCVSKNIYGPYEYHFLLYYGLCTFQLCGTAG